jgi:hypothetical protein
VKCSPMILEMYQKNLCKKIEEIEALYYDSIDELVQKIGDLDLPGIDMPDLSFANFSFVHDWEKGLISSSDVYDIFGYLNKEDAAKSKLTKRMVNFMMDNEVICDYFKPFVAKIEADCMARMIKYLEVMEKFFGRASAADEGQIPVVWLEQELYNGTMQTSSEEMTFNQVIRQLDTFVIGNTYQKFFFGPNIVVFDEFNKDDRTIHWLFAPEEYIGILKVLFQIKAELSGQEEKDYLKAILEDAS